MNQCFSNNLDINGVCLMVRDSLERGIVPIIEKDNLELLIDAFDKAVSKMVNETLENEAVYREARKDLITYMEKK